MAGGAFTILGGLLIWGLSSLFSKKKVLVSFDWEHDQHYRHLLKAWSENSKFDFEFIDVTPEEIQSNDIDVIKEEIIKRIKESTHVLALIGPKANTPHPNRKKIGYLNWICFEVAKSKELGKKLVAVKVEKRFIAPYQVKNSGAKWAYFDFESIKEALDEF